MKCLISGKCGCDLLIESDAVFTRVLQDGSVRGVRRPGGVHGVRGAGGGGAGGGERRRSGDGRRDRPGDGLGDGAQPAVL